MASLQKKQRCRKAKAAWSNPCGSAVSRRSAICAWASQAAQVLFVASM